MINYIMCFVSFLIFSLGFIGIVVGFFRTMSYEKYGYKVPNDTIKLIVMSGITCVVFILIFFHFYNNINIPTELRSMFL